MADPKDKIHLYNLMRRAREASLGEGGGPEVAIQALEQVSGRGSLGDRRVGSPRQRTASPTPDGGAIQSYQQALALKPDYDLAVINLANAYRSIGIG